MSEGYHSGVVFVDRNKIASESIGVLMQAWMAFYDQYHSFPWTEVMMFLSSVAR